MKKILLLVIVVSLLGCASVSMEKRLKEEPAFTFNTNSSIDETVNCLKTQWGTSIPFSLVDTKKGKMIFNGDPDSVGHIIEIISNQNNTTTVKAIIVSPWAIMQKNLMNRLKKCEAML
ncbi:MULTISPECIES: hypothetical protein [Pasteurellaceae]|uniref:Lipoprotein n=1 Tax=Pasteurella atlantica TaxID=2827233 RepID=A0AAW8CNQ6_9PAST|nr:hypothetical protein [Pasteurella atlantica]MBR0573681.1 hypothetical protein [Pasteurella atlantica]MDP8039686.1 hypothetical protein [Pasteurella atlantica]MDP8041777.1 hypothetical protein [Pasteurella atlantica]MDP8043949.1 hypothetical protein [Pasteurella atlantica]MDP8045927.1 hypothetical protein [Pasteurella atlantica]